MEAEHVRQQERVDGATNSGSVASVVVSEGASLRTCWARGTVGDAPGGE